METPVTRWSHAWWLHFQQHKMALNHVTTHPIKRRDVWLNGHLRRWSRGNVAMIRPQGNCFFLPSGLVMSLLPVLCSTTRQQDIIYDEDISELTDTNAVPDPPTATSPINIERDFRVNILVNYLNKFSFFWLGIYFWSCELFLDDVSVLCNCNVILM